MRVWHEKRVFLTGASSGIGEALAIALAKKGAVLGLVARREELLNELKDECEANGGTARFFACDVTDAGALQRAADDFRAEFGHIDVMIANAGISGGTRTPSSALAGSSGETFTAPIVRADAALTADEGVRVPWLDPSLVKQVIDINLLGAANAVYAVVPKMIERKSGHLVAISSLAGFRGLPKSAAYSASKAGMTAFFESVRLDVKHLGIDVTIIQPGFIKTPLTAGREAKMPFLMELDDAIPLFLRAIEKKKRFAAFPWQLATVVRLGKFMPAFLYDRIAGKARYRE